MLLLALACTAPVEEAPPPDVPCDDTDDTQLVVVSQLRFARRTDGVSLGFDLDRHVSDTNDPEGCHQEDLVDPNGVEGIDNAFSALLPILETTEGAAIEGLMQDAIDSGTLLVLLALEDVDDPVSDTCVNLEVLGGLGTPRLGTDGVLLSGQTYDRDPDTPTSRADGLAIRDGTLQAEGLALTLPMQIFDLAFTLELRDVSLHLQLDDLGGASGYLGGGIAIQPLIDLIEPREDIAIRELAIDLLRTTADLNPDAAGTCPDLSVVLELQATSAFLFDEAPTDTGDTAGVTGR